MEDPHSPERLRQIRELFEQALSLPRDERASFLQDTCANDKELIQEIESLLSETDASDSPLENLVNDMIWPALETLTGDPSQLDDYMDELLKPEEGKFDPLVGSSVSHFQILDTIGRGGMGIVYHARDVVLDREVALKFLPPAFSSDKDAKNRFINEAKAASSLDHPNIATVYEIGETTDGQLFIAMGYYPGKSLKEKISKNRVFPIKALDYAIQLAGGLKKAHENGVVHRDIKPGNVMITAEEKIVLLDFGVAKLSHESGYTQAGQMVGTLTYMSPEQTRGEAVDQRTDIWSFGVVLYEMLTGKVPFGGDNAPSIIRAILENDPEPPEIPEGEHPEALRDILGTCLEKDPDKRYQRMEDLLDDLKRCQEGLSPRRKRTSTTWNRRARHQDLLPLIPIVTVLVVAAIFVPILNPKGKVKFTRITKGPIVEVVGNFSDLSWGDYNNDGFVDVYIANQAEGSANILCQNNGDGTFTRVTEGVVATDRFGAMSPAWADQDNDGDLDLFVCSEFGVDVFYRNQGNGTFIKETDGTWVTTPGSGNITTWGDYDNDGFVDLYVANFGTPVHEANFLYHNRGDETMEPVNSVVNALTGASHGTQWTDYDDDGDVDLFVGGQDQVQFRNEGGGAFTWVSPEMGGIPRSVEDVDVGFWSGDYDNDGDLDIVYTTWKPDPSVVLYRNEGGSRFVDATHALPSAGSIRAMCASWGDYDNDGHLDLFIANRLGNNVIYHNDGNGSFSLLTESPLISEGNQSTGAAWVDYDNDGDLDLLVANGIWSDFGQSCELYRNEGGSNNWLLLNLVGTTSNRSAIGAKVRALATIDDYNLVQLREVSGGPSSDLRVHFGLGDATTINALRIEWPSGIVQELHTVAANQILTIQEE